MSQQEINDYLVMYFHYRNALVLGFSKEHAKQYANGMIKSNYDISHLIIK